MAPTPDLAERIRWLIRLRWFAVGGLVAASGAVRVAGLPVPAAPILGLAGLLLGFNVFFALQARRPPPPQPFAWWQVVTDLTILTLALHVAGGVENPFALFYVFHVIIASILLPLRISYLVAGLAAACYAGLALLELSGAVPHRALGFAAWSDPRFVGVAVLVMTSTLFLATYLASTIMEGLRRKDEEMRRVQEGLLQTEKLAAVGQLAAGIAHELNTPLASIAGYAEELEAIARGGGPKIEQYTGVIRAQTERCKAITQSLLNFARKNEIRPARLDVNPLLREAVDYLRFKKRAPRLEIDLDLQEGLPEVQADPGQLLQVFLSLLVNAADAVEGGGRISVRSREEAGGVRVTVTDTGVGIPEENLKKVFEPFFTTKAPGRGTGLGLSLSYGLVRGLGGKIELTSRVGSGTEVRVQLPR